MGQPDAGRLNGRARAHLRDRAVAKALALHPEKPRGGRLLLAEVTKDDLRISTLSRVTDRAAIKV